MVYRQTGNPYYAHAMSIFYVQHQRPHANVWPLIMQISNYIYYSLY